jgi:RNA polymerase sigma-70 factor (ECF subfamily)
VTSWLASSRIIGQVEQLGGTDGERHAYTKAGTALPEVDPSDAMLVRRVAVGDQAALGSLYDRYAGLVFASVTRFLGDRSAAEEVVQETFIALWRRADQYDDGTARLSTWLLGIARNRAIDRLRAAARRPRLVSDDDERHSGAEPGAALAAAGDADGSDPEAQATRSWVRAVVRSALDAMPDLERRVLELAYDEQLTQAEIASRLGWPLGTVKTRTRRALGSLREALGDVPDLHHGDTLP